MGYQWEQQDNNSNDALLGLVRNQPATPPATPPVTRDAQYRGEPITKVDSGVNYTTPPVGVPRVGIATPPISSPLAQIPARTPVAPVAANKSVTAPATTPAPIIPAAPTPPTVPPRFKYGPDLTTNVRNVSGSLYDYVYSNVAPKENISAIPFLTQDLGNRVGSATNAILGIDPENYHREARNRVILEPVDEEDARRRVVGLTKSALADPKAYVTKRTDDTAYKAGYMSSGKELSPGYLNEINKAIDYLVSNGGDRKAITTQVQNQINKGIQAWQNDQDDGFGFGDFLKAVAPMVLSVAVPGIGTAISGALSGTLGTGLANTLATGAIIGGGTSALTGGNVLKGAALGGLGAGVSQGIGSLTSGLDPSIVQAAQGAGSTLVKGAVTGNIDPMSILASAGTGYLSNTVKSSLEDLYPTQNLYEQNIAPGIKPEVSVAGALENIGRNTAINAPGTLISGGNLGDTLTNAAINETVKTATGQIPRTDVDIIDRVIAGTAGQYLGNELRDVTSPAPATGPRTTTTVANAPSPAPGPAPSPVDVTASSDKYDYSDIVPLLMAMGLSDGQAQVEPQMFQAPQMTTLPGQLPGQLGGQPTSLAELLALLNTRRA